jgi:D-alanyl-D-alanine carboxypeptidase/D-alanyl-D-alanine-endopeptidase (penicillin-binding protein 4)
MRTLAAVALLHVLVAAPAAAEEPLPLLLEPLLEPVLMDRALRGVDVAAVVVRVSDGEVVYARDPDRALNGASTMKVVTAATALRALGPAWRFQTVVERDGEIDADGVLHGNLYVRGGGDPTLVVERLWKLVHDVSLAGVSKIDGDVVFDGSTFAPGEHIVGWDKREDLENGPAYFPTLGALSVNFNTVALVTGPGPTVGSAARVVVETPVGDHVTVVSTATTGTERAANTVRIERKVLPDGRLEFAVSGVVPAGTEVDRHYRAVADPTAHFVAAFREMMKREPIAVSGRYKVGTSPGDATRLARSTSPPLAAVLGDMNKHSNNFIAEQVLRAVGAATSGTPGSSDNGMAAVSAYLGSLGLDPSADRLVNGSGLAKAFAIRPSTLVAVLRDMDRDPLLADEFRASLSIAGVDGTLVRRGDQPGLFRGKTGTLDGVHCLTGVVDADGGDRYAFAFLANDIDGTNAQVRRVQDRFVEELSMAQATEVALGGPR